MQKIIFASILFIILFEKKMRLTLFIKFIKKNISTFYIFLIRTIIIQLPLLLFFFFTFNLNWISLISYSL